MKLAEYLEKIRTCPDEKYIKIVLAYVDDRPLDTSLRAKLPESAFPYLSIDIFTNPGLFLEDVRKKYRPHIILMDTNVRYIEPGYKLAREIRQIYDCHIIGTSNDTQAKNDWNYHGFPFMAKENLCSITGGIYCLQSIIEDLHIRLRSEKALKVKT